MDSPENKSPGLISEGFSAKMSDQASHGSTVYGDNGVNKHSHKVNHSQLIQTLLA